MTARPSRYWSAGMAWRTTVRLPLSRIRKGVCGLALGEFLFTRAVLAGRRVPIDVYRMADYTLPGILASRSAEQGGQAIAVPDIRHEPFSGTQFWEHVGLPDDEPEGRKYESDSGLIY